jgi:hypothetical protein
VPGTAAIVAAAGGVATTDLTCAVTDDELMPPLSSSVPNDQHSARTRAPASDRDQINEKSRARRMFHAFLASALGHVDPCFRALRGACAREATHIDFGMEARLLNVQPHPTPRGDI